MSENLIISILRDIRSEVWNRYIPSSNCPEYIEYHKNCVEIMNFILDKMDMFKGKTNKEVAEMLLREG